MIYMVWISIFLFSLVGYYIFKLYRELKKEKKSVRGLRVYLAIIVIIVIMLMLLLVTRSLGIFRYDFLIPRTI